MQIVTPYARIRDEYFSLNDGIMALKNIESIARVSHASEDKQTEDSWKKFITSIVIRHGDWSVVEHEMVTVDALVDRGITHEWVRHRLGAYTQESTRFVDYAKEKTLSFICPMKSSDTWYSSVCMAEDAYFQMRDDGITPQIARSILPNSLASKLIVTYNLRMWRHFFLMRTTKETHPQMLEVSIPLLKEFQEKIPILYIDIVPLQSQRFNLTLPH